MNEERHWIITFSNGNQEIEFIGTYEGAVDYANEMMRKYAKSMANTVFGWDEEYNDDEFEKYCENCEYEIEESEETEDEKI